MFTKKLSAALFLSACLLVQAGAPFGNVASAEQTESFIGGLYFLEKDLYADILKKFPEPPSEGDARQRADEETLLRLQKTRTTAECNRARSEVFVDFAAWFSKPHSALTQANIAKVSPLMSKVTYDARYFAGEFKDEFDRARPYDYIRGLVPCISKVFFNSAYPSGHATLGRIYAVILADLFPAQRKQLLDRGDQIGLDRVIGGVHHPSDIEAGRYLADRLYVELKKSKEFMEEYQDLARKVGLR